MKKTLMKPILAMACAMGLSNAFAAGGPAVELEDVEIDTSTPAVKSGALIVMENCIQCHSLKYIKYRHLLEIGFSKEEVDALRGDKGMNDPLERTMDINMMSDMFGMVPPDLTLMAKARKQGDRYLYSLLVGYEQDEEGNTVNKVFPGIAMPDVLGYSFASEQEKEELRKKAHDITAFLIWASDPKAAQREQLGVYVMAYLFMLTVLFYLLKKRIWANVKVRREAEAGDEGTTEGEVSTKA